jgi:hypothetical protein
MHAYQLRQPTILYPPFSHDFIQLPVNHFLHLNVLIHILTKIILRVA